LNCVEVANKIRYIPKRTLVVASSRDIEVEEYEEVVGDPDSSPVLRRSSSAESVNDVSPFQEPMMEVEEEFAPTSRPTLRYPRIHYLLLLFMNNSYEFLLKIIRHSESVPKIFINYLNSNDCVHSHNTRTKK